MPSSPSSASAGRRRLLAAICLAVALLTGFGVSVSTATPHDDTVATTSGPGEATEAGIEINPEAEIEAPPEPEAAAQQVLPLQLAPDAEVELDQPVDPAQADTTVRDLRQQPPAVPTSAKSWSDSSAGEASTLVLFDTTGDYAKLGEYYALGMGNLASHSGTVTAMPVVDYVSGLAGRYTSVIYVGSTYNEPLPEAFISDVLTGDVPVLWAGFNIWQLAATDANRATFDTRYGWDAATSFIDSEDTVTTVTYNNRNLERNALNSGGILSPHITDASKVNVVGQAQCTTAEGATKDCAGIAQSSGSTFPWAVRSANLTYVGEIPLSYIGERDRYLALADLVLDLTDPDSVDSRLAAIRIEDITPAIPAEDLQVMVDYLASEGVPFQIAVVPIYTDPKGVENDGVPTTWTLADKPELVAVLKDAVAKGGTLIQHGTTHQYGALDNPYNGVSADDFEFIRSWCTAENSFTAPQVPCDDDKWVQIGGPVGLKSHPATTIRMPDGRSLVAPNTTLGSSVRIRQGRDIFKAVGLPTPEIFEVPHYSATAEAYQGIRAVYSTRYERALYYGGTLTGKSSGPSDYFGQFFPYVVNDVYGSKVLPENLGNYSPVEMNHHVPRPPSVLIDAAEANLVVDHATASFFFHPYYELQYLQEIVQGVKGAGYTFVPAANLR